MYSLLRLQTNAPFVPDVVMSAEGCASFRNSDVYLVADGGILGQCTAKIGEPVHRIHYLAIDCDVGLNVRFPRGRLM